jgi:hypothetical protein
MAKKKASSTKAKAVKSTRNKESTSSTGLPGHKAAKPHLDKKQIPPALLALVHLPVSGLYVGQMTLPTAGAFEMELRVDIDQSQENSPVLNRVSWDLSQIFTANGSTWRVYRNSSIIEQPTVVWNASDVKIGGTAKVWGSSSTVSADISIPWNGLTIGNAQVTLGTGLSAQKFACARQSTGFRHVELQIDVCTSVNANPLLPSYDTHSHNDRPTGTVQRVLTIESAYSEAGINVTIPATHKVIDDSDPQFVSWTPSELHQAMEDHFAGLSSSPQWRLWGVMAGEFENAGVGGIMFDAASQFGGAGKAPERQGFAVFRKHPWFDKLVVNPTSQAQAEAMRKFLYTWVHEAGHAFNHLHSWDKARPQALSWMNYDWKYDDIAGNAAFWKNFQFRFDEEELLHLRHGSRNAVIMGGDSWGSGGHLESEHSELSELELIAGTPPIEVLLRSKELYAFMEPVTLEIRLRNLTKSNLLVDSNLQPEFGIVAFLIKGPDGNVRQYDSLMCKLAERKQVSLSAVEKIQTGADRHSLEIDLTFGKDGFYFDRPGLYSIRAVLQGIGGTLIPSNLQRIQVGYPLTPESESLAQDFFTSDVGVALCLNGSRSPRLHHAMETLEEIAVRFPSQSIGAKAATVVAAAAGRPFYRTKGNRFSCEHKANPQEALDKTEAALSMLGSSSSKSANIPHRELVEQRKVYWLALDSKEKAKSEAASLKGILERRGVNPSVIKKIS